MSAEDTSSGTNSRLEGKEESVVLYEQFESKVSELAKSKRQSDRKAKKLSSDLRKLRSENQKLKDQLRQVLLNKHMQKKKHKKTLCKGVCAHVSTIVGTKASQSSARGGLCRGGKSFISVILKNLIHLSLGWKGS